MRLLSEGQFAIAQNAVSSGQRDTQQRIAQLAVVGDLMGNSQRSEMGHHLTEAAILTQMSRPQA